MSSGLNVAGPTWHCAICGVGGTNYKRQRHLNGPRHRKKAAEASAHAEPDSKPGGGLLSVLSNVATAAHAVVNASGGAAVDTAVSAPASAAHADLDGASHASQTDVKQTSGITPSDPQASAHTLVGTLTRDMICSANQPHHPHSLHKGPQILFTCERRRRSMSMSVDAE